MVKDSAEGEDDSLTIWILLIPSTEKIMQTGKKKLVLDHLIVQKMDDDDGSTGDVQSILMYGAMALFEDGGDQTGRDIQCEPSSRDLLIKR